jgi:hypothetical protein
MLGFNKVKRTIPDTSKSERGLTITIPHWMLVKYKLDMCSNLYIECKREGILISRLDLFP